MTVDLAQLSGLAQLAWAFGAGLLSFFTPCVYPLIPVTLAAFGVTPETSRLRGLLLGACYVAGISVTYAVLGIISARTGVVFGSLLGSPWIVATLSIFLFVLALFSIDLISLRFTSHVQTAAGRIGGEGFLGAFLMGTVSGFVAAPCIGPALVTILGVAALSHDMGYGALLLVLYALGFGFPFIILGMYSGLLQTLPRSGNWLYLVKTLIATGVLMVIFFLWHGLAENLFASAGSLLGIRGIVVLGVVGGILAGYSAHIEASRRRLLASILLASALFFGTVPNVTSVITTAPAAALSWNTSIDDALARAKETGRPVMVDLYADWCAACKELEALTFANDEVRRSLSSEFAVARIDFTTDTPATEKVTEQFQIVGLPTILFLKPDGTEIRTKRLEGFLAPQKFLAHLEEVKSAAGVS